MFTKTSGTLSLLAAPSSVNVHHDYLAIHFAGLTVIAKERPPHDLDMASRPVLQLRAHLEAEGWIADEVTVIARADSEDQDAAPSPSSAPAPRPPAAVPGSGAAFAQLSRTRSSTRPSAPRPAGPAAASPGSSAPAAEMHPFHPDVDQTPY
ncbi:MAG: hypothetical protein E6Q67_03085 [Roseateles sp.]|nr:MAG: hypothetical protein E6Q67_03085 [Roseateles sp.]